METRRLQFSLTSIFVAALWPGIKCVAWVLDLASLPYMETTWYGGPLALAVVTLRFVPLVGIVGAFFGLSAAWMTVRASFGRVPGWVCFCCFGLGAGPGASESETASSCITTRARGHLYFFPAGRL